MDFEEAKRILAALEREGVRYVLIGSMAMAAQGLIRATRDIPAIEYIPPHGLYSLDILSRLGEAFVFENIEWEELIVDGIRVRVATPRMLYRMKKDTVRPLDRIHAEAMRERFGLPEND
jgi:hypothetical protein